MVDEGGAGSISTLHLKASDLDTVEDKLTISLITPPQFGYIENVLPSPGFEKSNTGISIGENIKSCYPSSVLFVCVYMCEFGWKHKM